MIYFFYNYFVGVDMIVNKYSVILILENVLEKELVVVIYVLVGVVCLIIILEELLLMVFLNKE